MQVWQKTIIWLVGSTLNDIRLMGVSGFMFQRSGWGFWLDNSGQGCRVRQLEDLLGNNLQLVDPGNLLVKLE